MLVKFLKFWMKAGYKVLDEYTKLSPKMALVLMVPYYVLFAIPYTVVLVLGLLIYAVKCKLEGSLTFKETFGAVKEGVQMGCNEIQKVEFGKGES